jgi:hypothetical protein
LLVRRRVYEDMRVRLDLPWCNERFGRPLVPFFRPLIMTDDAGPWYMSEDYSFCERARRCGYRVWADTTIRLHHLGQHGYTWEDAGGALPRFDTYHFDVR